MAAGGLGLVALGWFAWRAAEVGSGRRDDTAQRRALIVDQLDLTAPGEAFLAEAHRRLEGAGFAVTVVPAREATVERLRRLPEHDADIIVLRMHSARIARGTVIGDDIALFTGEPVDLEAMPMVGLPSPVATAVAEARGAPSSAARRGDSGPRFSAAELRALVPMVYAVDGRELPYIGLRPAFIGEHTIGRFRAGAAVVLMGCDSLRSVAMADAFRRRGAAAVVGWDRPVSAEHTDRATLAVIDRLATTDGPATDVAAIVASVNAALGPDPASGARLVGRGGPVAAAGGSY